MILFLRNKNNDNVYEIEIYQRDNFVIVKPRVYTEEFINHLSSIANQYDVNKALNFVKSIIRLETNETHLENANIDGVIKEYKIIVKAIANNFDLDFVED